MVTRMLIRRQQDQKRRLVNAAYVAERFGVTPEYVRQACGPFAELRVYRLTERMPRYDLAEVEQLLEKVYQTGQKPKALRIA